MGKKIEKPIALTIKLALIFAMGLSLFVGWKVFGCVAAAGVVGLVFRGHWK